MKKAVILLLSLLFIFSACTDNGAAQNFGNFVENYGTRNSSPPYVAIPEPFDYKKQDNADFTDTMGFKVSNYLDGGNFTIKTIYSVEWFGQLEYISPEGSMVLRVASDQRQALYTMYEEKHNVAEESFTVGDVSVLLGTGENGCRLATWKSDGYQYSLHARKAAGLTADIVKLFVENTSCE